MDGRSVSVEKERLEETKKNSRKRFWRAASQSEHMCGHGGQRYTQDNARRMYICPLNQKIPFLSVTSRVAAPLFAYHREGALGKEWKVYGKTGSTQLV